MRHGMARLTKTDATRQLGIARSTLEFIPIKPSVAMV
jgi:hypothetical protein